MSSVLWAKPGMDIDADIQRFLAGDDVILDREFIRYDLRASAAHAEGLQRIGILTADELAAILRELSVLDAEVAESRFVLDERFEDMHSAIESRLIERLGDVGKKIHTGRSRNDQVLVATRLWLRDRLAHAEVQCHAAV
ncbi:MAG: argininosuccinate lyase, partial [Aquincola sp.]|nr:argininosuccinate lyase [Aquincola sp.]